MRNLPDLLWLFVSDESTLEPQGVVATQHSTVTLTILTNDDPNGVLIFNSNSIELTVAEDYSDGAMNATYTTLEIVRRQGLLGDVKASFELECNPCISEWAFNNLANNTIIKGSGVLIPVTPFSSRHSFVAALHGHTGLSEGVCLARLVRSMLPYGLSLTGLMWQIISQILVHSCVYKNCCITFTSTTLIKYCYYTTAIIIIILWYFSNQVVSS